MERRDRILLFSTTIERSDTIICIEHDGIGGLQIVSHLHIELDEVTIEILSIEVYLAIRIGSIGAIE
jgi:hypothetical protein